MQSTNRILTQQLERSTRICSIHRTPLCRIKIYHATQMNRSSLVTQQPTEDIGTLSSDFWKRAFNRLKVKWLSSESTRAMLRRSMMTRVKSI